MDDLADLVQVVLVRQWERTGSGIELIVVQLGVSVDGERPTDDHATGVAVGLEYEVAPGHNDRTLELIVSIHRDGSAGGEDPSNTGGQRRGEGVLAADGSVGRHGVGRMEAHGGDVEVTASFDDDHDGLPDQSLRKHDAYNIGRNRIDLEDLDGIVVGSRIEGQHIALNGSYTLGVPLEVAVRVHMVFFKDGHVGSALDSVEGAASSVEKMAGSVAVVELVHDHLGFGKRCIDLEISSDLDAHGVLEGLDEGSVDGRSQSAARPLVQLRVLHEDTTALESSPALAMEIATDQNGQGIVVPDREAAVSVDRIDLWVGQGIGTLSS
ncbi:unnamed protein product [Pseudo-nitzschia multistriata]|uniref:Uncharacterized protein n=1 Tax=Pseudo-nitzschia multistriata TaxID=183589 RepID=A0A448ZHN0_9STRA|nr:unnamed protein product [Pseudo-nitzschia multistriata]